MMMRKRSNHIPIRIEIEAIDVPKMLRVRLIARIGKGMTKQNRTINQNRIEYFPANFAQKIAFSAVPPP
jgi:hypothetical protein